jgi:hydrogenase expression/formation protein HypC
MCLAVPGKIISIEGGDAAFRSGRVNFGGIVKSVNLSYVPDAKPGEYVLVHVGFALSVVDEAEAQKVFEYLRGMGELEELKEEVSG